MGTDRGTAQDVILPIPDERGGRYGRPFHFEFNGLRLVSREFYWEAYILALLVLSAAS